MNTLRTRWWSGVTCVSVFVLCVAACSLAQTASVPLSPAPSVQNALPMSDASDLTTYGRRVMASGPFLYYSFDEASGVAQDLVSQDVARQLIAVTPVRTAHAPFGSAVDTSAGNSNVHPERTNGTWVNTSTGIPTVTGSFAVEWMMKWNGFALGGNLVRSPLDCVTITFDDMGGGNMGFHVWSWSATVGHVSSEVIYAQDNNPDLQEWHHFVLADNNSTKQASLYVDGVQRANWGWNGTIDATLDISDLRIGGWADPTYGRAFRGQIDEVAFYDLTNVGDVDQAAAAIASHSILTGPAYVVLSPESIHTQAGETATFTVIAAGAEPLAFEWRKDGLPLSAAPDVSGIDTPVLQIVDADLDDVGQYTCLVSNTLGSEESAPAALTLGCFQEIAGDFNGDCVVDLKDFQHLSAAWHKTASQLNLVFACAADNDLYVLMQNNGAFCPRYDTAAQAIAQADDYAGVLLLADDYPAGRTQVDAALFAQAAAKHLKVYVEYPSMVPDLSLGEPAYIATGAYGANIERTVVTSDAFEPDLAPMRIMMINDCHYLPVAVAGAHLALSRVEGYDYAVYGLGAVSHPILFEHPTEQVMVSTTKLSQFITARYSPQEVWPGVWRMILNWLVGSPTRINLQYAAEVRPTYSADELLPRDARRQAIRRGVEWYWKSRLFIDPTWPAEVHPGLDPLPRDYAVGDGTNGIAEAYIGKRIFYTGNQAVSRSPRNDCNGPVAGSLSLAGAIFNEPRYSQMAVKLHDFIYNSAMAIGPQSDPQSPSYGLVLAAPGWAYWHSDNAMSLMGFMLSAAIQQSDRWDEDIVRTTLANFRVTGVNGFRPPALYEADLQANGWQYYWNLNYIHLNPHMQSGIWCSYLWLYDKTGFEPLLERTETGIRLLMEAWPNWQLEANRFEQERARMLLPLAWLVRTQDTPEHRAWLDTVAQYIISIQDQCGALPQIPGHVITSNDAYGTTECAIVHQAGDPATDLLYTLNFAFPGMHEAVAATGNPAYVASAQKMEDFLIRCQTRSEEQPELDGTWYRGFDFAKWDYWGSDGDAGWGIWSTETGWTSGEIISTLAVRELGTSRWDLAQQCTAAQYMDDYRSWMLPDEVLP